MLSQWKVSFILPTLNEKEGLKKTLTRIPEAQLRRLGYPFEILVVDGGSGDGTQQVAKEHGTRLIINEGGYGIGVLTGLAHAEGDIIVVSDADDTYPLEHTHKYLQLMETENLDYLTTNRLVQPRRAAFPAPHLIGNKLLNVLFFLLFGVKLSDSQTGLLIFKQSLINQSDLHHFGDHFAFNSELKLMLSKHAKKMAEIPIPYRRRLCGETKQDWYITGPKILLSWLKTKLFFLAPKPASHQHG